MRQIKRLINVAERQTGGIVLDEDLLHASGLSRLMLAALFAIQIDKCEQINSIYKKLPVFKQLLKEPPEKRKISGAVASLIKLTEKNLVSELQTFAFLLAFRTTSSVSGGQIEASQFRYVSISQPLTVSLADELLSTAHERNFILNHCTSETVLHAEKLTNKSREVIVQWLVERPSALYAENATSQRWLFLYLASKGFQPTLGVLPLMQTSTNSIERLLGLFKSQPTTRLELSIFIARALNTLGEPIPSTVVNELIKNINKSREALIEVSVNSTNIEHLKRNYLWLKADTIKRNIPPSMLDFAPFLRVMPEAERHQAERRLANIPLASFGNVFLIARVRQALESLSIPRQRIGPSLQDFMSVSADVTSELHVVYWSKQLARPTTYSLPCIYQLLKYQRCS